MCDDVRTGVERGLVPSGAEDVSPAKYMLSCMGNSAYDGS